MKPRSNGSGCLNRKDNVTQGGTKDRPAFTLVEMVMVLVVMAILATVAVQMLEPQVDQTRYDATRRTLENVREGIVARPDANSINAAVSGFVTDCGRLPVDLTELFLQPGDLSGHAAAPFDSDRDASNDVQLFGGWQGPYVALPVGTTALVDGWGNPLALDTSSGFQIFSRGRDGDSVAPEVGYDEDLIVQINDSDWQTAATFRLYEADISGLIDPAPTDNQRLGVLLYAVGAAGGTNGTVEEATLKVPFPGHPVASQSIDYEHSWTLGPTPARPLGTIAFRGILWEDTNGDGVLAGSGEVIVKKSVIRYRSLRGGESIREELVLR